MSKSLRLTAVSATLFISLLLFGTLSSSAWGAEQTINKWQSVMEFYDSVRQQYMTLLLFEDAKPTEADMVTADYQAFLETFQYMSDIGGKKYDRMVKRQTAVLIANTDRLTDKKFARSQKIAFEREYEKIFGKAKDDDERLARSRLIGGAVGFRFLDATLKDDDDDLLRAKMVLTIVIRPPVKTVVRSKKKMTAI
ncbi:MAG: hypothetical protein WAV46_00695 [Candidatus Moraniibacteriota bacterium]